MELYVCMYATAGKLATLLEWKPLLDVSSDVVQMATAYLIEENMDIILEVEDETAAEGAVIQLPESDGSHLHTHIQMMKEFFFPC